MRVGRVVTAFARVAAAVVLLGAPAAGSFRARADDGDAAAAATALVARACGDDAADREVAAWELMDLAARERSACVAAATPLLDAPDVRTRALGILVLGSAGDAAKPLHGRVSGLLAAKERLLRVAAADALIQWGPAAAGAVLPSLKHADPVVRSSAAAVLGSYGGACPPAAITPLVQALDDAAVRPAAVWALGRIGAKAVEPLSRRLAGSDNLARAAAARALGAMGPTARAAADDLAKLLPAAPVDIKAQLAASGAAQLEKDACAALGRMGPDATAAVPALLACVKACIHEPFSAQRGGPALVALGKIGEPAKTAVPEMVRALDDPGLAWEAATALGAMGPVAESATEPLLRCLSSGPELARHAAAQALGSIGGKDSERILAALLDRLGDQEFEPFVTLGLRRLGGPAVPALLERARSRDAKVAESARDVLRHMSSRAADALAAVLADPSSDAADRARAATALAGIEGDVPRRATALTRALQDADPGVRTAAARAAVVREDQKSVAAALALRLTDEAPRVRAAAVWTLADAGADAAPALEALRKAAGDGDPVVRLGAVVAVARVRGEPASAFPTIAASLGSPDEAEQSWALHAIRLLGRGDASLAPQVHALLSSPSDTHRRLALDALPALGAHGVTAVPRVLDAMREGLLRSPHVVEALSQLRLTGLVVVVDSVAVAADGKWALSELSVCEHFGPRAAPLLAERGRKNRTVAATLEYLGSSPFLRDW